jgi:hypothetical protein
MSRRTHPRGVNVTPAGKKARRRRLRKLRSKEADSAYRQRLKEQKRARERGRRQRRREQAEQNFYHPQPQGESNAQKIKQAWPTDHEE